jgi:hypothetical protein
MKYHIIPKPIGRSFFWVSAAIPPIKSELRKRSPINFSEEKLEVTLRSGSALRSIGRMKLLR